MLKLNKKIYKILVIGGAGFIGFHLVKKLYSKGYIITVFDNLSNPSRDYKKNPFPVIKGDILSKKNSLAKIITTLNPNFIIDLAAYHYIPLCIKNPVKTRNVNVVGTKNILNSIRKFSPNTHLIYSSSAAIYAPSTHPHQVSSRIRPIDIYGQTKKEAEKEIQLNSKTFGTKYTILRLFNVYGPGDNTPHLIPEIIKQIKKSTIRLGNKNTCRDYIYVDDVVNGIIHVIKNENVSVNKTFNLGTGKSYSASETSSKPFFFLPIIVNLA